MISLFEDLNSSYEQWLYIKPQKFLERQMKNIRSKYRALRYLKTIPWGIPWCLHRILVVYDDSPVIAWLFNIGWFIYGLQSGLEDRWPSPAGENEMGFGQLVPIFLLISTVFVVREAWDDEVDKEPNGSSSLPDTTEDDQGSMHSGTYLMRQQQNTEDLRNPPRRVDTEQRIGMEPLTPPSSSNFARRRTGIVETT
ncbi:MAG: hypothetical protein OHK93_005222 [Ramalina farinacea]|uniref:Uncharacterized protein n=1 Tax=Ramalina farinacea TaxID=258253 RepID=A0AA43QYV9_9LECA|nr:hypothetical protein [Ramalina farinacea]